MLAEQWDAQPPREPLIAAGSTGTGPATADLLGVIARAPQGWWCCRASTSTSPRTPGARWTSSIRKARCGA